MLKKKIAVIGAGNMGSALIAGLAKSGYEPNKIYVSNPKATALDALKQQFNVQTSTDNKIAAVQADIIILAVKPSVLKTVTLELTDIILRNKPLLISIAAMIPTTHFEHWLPEPIPLVRAMPNMPAQIGCGITTLYHSSIVTAEQKQWAETIFNAVGTTVWINDENLMNVTTLLSGSGPAFFFYLMEVLQQGAEKKGLPSDIAKTLTIQTAFGAAKLALESKQTPAMLRRQVTSPGGTTEQAFKILAETRLDALMIKIFELAEEHAIKVADQYR